MGKSAFLMGKSLFSMGKSTINIYKSPFSRANCNKLLEGRIIDMDYMDDSHGKSPFIIGKPRQTVTNY
jgi:hypothetical protein